MTPAAGDVCYVIVEVYRGEKSNRRSVSVIDRQFDNGKPVARKDRPALCSSRITLAVAFDYLPLETVPDIHKLYAAFNRRAIIQAANFRKLP